MTQVGGDMLPLTMALCPEIGGIRTPIPCEIPRLVRPVASPGGRLHFLPPVPSAEMAAR